MSATRVANKTNRMPCLVIAGVAGCLFLCLAVAAIGGAWFYLIGPGTTAPIMQDLLQNPTRVRLGGQVNPPLTRVPGQPVVTPAPLDQTAMETYEGSEAPFTVLYPADWEVTDDEADNNTAIFVSPDQDAYATVTYSVSSSASVDAAIDRMTQDVLGQAGPLQVTAKNRNPDGSVLVEFECTNPDLGGPAHGYARLVRFQGSDYLVVFEAGQDRFGPYKPMATAIVNSLHVTP